MKLWNKAFGKTRMMIIGIILIGIGVGVFRIANFGVDPFTCMNLGISQFLKISFGTWQLIINLIILCFVFFIIRGFIGIGTMINMIGVGYIADFVCWVLREQMNVVFSITISVIALILGILLVSFGCALYMNANLGIAPYDCVAYIIEKVSKGKITFSRGRIFSDIVVVCIGIFFGMCSKQGMNEMIGIGTILNAMLNGPIIQFFKNLTGGKNHRNCDKEKNDSPISIMP